MAKKPKRVTPAQQAIAKQNSIKIQMPAKVKVGKRARDTALSIEQTVLEATMEESSQKGYIPHHVGQSVVTLDDQSTKQLLGNITLSNISTPEQLEEAMTPSTASMTTQKVSLPEEVLDTSIATRNLTEMHRAVIEAVLSQLHAGNKSFTSSMVYRTLCGKGTNFCVHREQQDMVESIMTDLMYTPLSIELGIYDDKGNTGVGVMESAIIPAEKLQVTISGVKCTAYKVTKLPAILRFCYDTGTLAVTPMDLLSVDINFTTKNLILLNILQRQVAPLLYPTTGEAYTRPAPLELPYSMFYDAAMEASSTKEQANETQFKARIRKTLAIIMDTWQAGHYIEKWTPLKVGNQYNSFRIYFPKNAPPALPEADQTRLNHLSEFL
mgnify:FL=1